MKLLITDSNPTTIWTFTESGQVEQLEFTDFTRYDLYSDTVSLSFDLPNELGDKILYYLFWDYLLDRTFDQALDLVTISKYYLRKFYREIYGQINLNRIQKGKETLELYQRLARTFLFCESIDDYFVSPRMTTLNSCLRVGRPGVPYRVVSLRPWQFGKYVVTESFSSIFFSETRQIMNYNIGPSNSDTVWISGSTTRGIMNVESLHHPILNLILCDSVDNLLPTAKMIKSNYYFKDFIRLLKLVYGEDMLINFMVKEDDNPFIVSSESFISIQ